MTDATEDPAVVLNPAEFRPIMVAVPALPWAWSEATTAIMHLLQRVPPGSGHADTHGTVSDVVTARNDLTRRFLAKAAPFGLDYMLWVDSDMVPAPETALRLLTVAREVDADIVSALYCSRRPPFGFVFQPLGWPEGNYSQRIVDVDPGVREVARVGMGCALVHRRVYERLAAPWFEYPATQPGGAEDFLFCDKARAAGFRVWLDADWEVPHLAVMPITSPLARAWRSTLPQAEP